MRPSKKSLSFQKTISIPLVLLLLSGLMFPSQAETRKKSPSLFGITIGLGMTIGGTMYASWQYRKAQDAYLLYTKSAFTDNTTDLRDNVQSHEHQMLLGSLIAGLGAVCVVVSF